VLLAMALFVIGVGWARNFRGCVTRRATDRRMNALVALGTGAGVPTIPRRSRLRRVL